MSLLPHRSLVLLLATLAAAAACGDGGAERAGEPRQLLPAADDGNLVLVVANHSTELDPLDIGVTIDGEPAVEGDFASGTDYMFQFDLPMGNHALSVDSIDIDTTRIITFSLGNEVSYGVLEYEDDSDEQPTTSPLFTWEFLDEPPELGPQ
jgi:hypothetical protein